MRQIKTGFTIIELTISIAFISTLLLAIIFVTNGLTANYSKGISLKKINTVGRDLIDDFSTSINDSPTVEYETLCAYYFATGTESHAACVADHASRLIFQEYYYQDITSHGSKIDKIPAFGVFCTGKNSYIWNTGYSFEEETYWGEDKNAIPHAELVFRLASDPEGSESHTYGGADRKFRLLKLPDPNRFLCAAQLIGKDQGTADYSVDSNSIYNGNVSGTTITFDISRTYATFIDGTRENKYGITAEPVELISSSDIGGLALYDFAIFPPVVAAYNNDIYYTGSFVLGTLNTGVTVLTGGEYCTPPPNLSSEVAYCALNKFNFAMRATGGK